MSTQDLTADAMSLPLPERIQLAQALWQSIDGDLPDVSERDAITVAMQRDEELKSGAVIGRSHEEVMSAARL